MMETVPFVSNQDTPMEIVFTDPQLQRQMLVPPPSNQDTLKEKPKDEVRFKSDATRRTELETVARPRPAPIQAPILSGGQRGEQNKTNRQKETLSEYGSYKSEDDREVLKLPGFGGPSSQPTVPEFVQQQMPPGVRLGNVTALNTDQHKYYSFNQRLLQRFVPLWGRRVRSALYQWIKENNAPAVSKTWVTNVEVIMDPKGEILEVQPFRLSGLWSIDEASINSFKEVRNVPNPPAEMVDENGYIHLQFQTEVYWIPQPNMRFQSGNEGL
jgi:hypothetical protein